MLNIMLIHQSCINKLNIPKVDDLFKIQICKFMYLFINCMLPESFMNIFTPPHVKTRRTNMVSKTLIHQGPKLWQELPFDIQNSKSCKLVFICFIYFRVSHSYISLFIDLWEALKLSYVLLYCITFHFNCYHNAQFRINDLT